MGAFFNINGLKPVIDSYRDLTKGRQRVVLTGLFLVPVILFLSLLFFPRLNQIQALSIQQQPLKTQLALMKRQAARQPQLQAELEATRRLFDQAKETLPDSDEISVLLDNVARLVIAAFKLHGDGQFNEKIPELFRSRFKEKKLQSGGVAQAGRFFEAVAALPRLINFASIEMAPEKEGPQLITTCTAITYKYLNTPPDAEDQKVENAP